MSDSAIRVEHLSKLYPLGRAQQRHDTTSASLGAGLPDAVADFRQRAPQFRALRIADLTKRNRQSAEDLWALHDVGFKVKSGQRSVDGGTCSR